MIMKKKYSRKAPIIAIVAISIIGILAGTIAFFTTTETYKNRYKPKPYSTEIIEEFTSPTDWKPGDVTPKIISITNTGGSDMAVRVSYKEKWLSQNGTTLSGKQLINNGNSEINAAIIKFDNENKWIKNGGYYYYYKKLSPTEKAESFIKAVEFNSLIVSDTTCTYSNNNKDLVCESSGNGYDGATYTLTINVETVQFNSYKTIWNTEVNIEGVSE